MIGAGAAGLREVVGTSGPDLDNCIKAYNVAIVTTFYLCAAGAVVAFVAAFGMEWRSVKNEHGADVKVAETKVPAAEEQVLPEKKD